MKYIPKYSRDRMKKRKEQQRDTTVRYKSCDIKIVQHLNREMRLREFDSRKL